MPTAPHPRPTAVTFDTTIPQWEIAPARITLTRQSSDAFGVTYSATAYDASGYAIAGGGGHSEWDAMAACKRDLAKRAARIQSGDYGTSTSGDYGTSTSGDYGTSTSGDCGEIRIRWWDGNANRYRLAVGYVGEDGILPGVAYVVRGGKLVRKDGAP